MSKAEPESTPFDIVCAMEDDVSAVQDFADVLARMAEAMDEEWARPVQRLAWTIRDLAIAIGERQGNLSRALHPNPEAVIWATAAAE
jgi:hypothetical protein